MSKKRYIFSLVGVNIEKVDQKYGIAPMSSLAEEDTIPENTTKIVDLEIIRKTPDVVSFLDESKRLRKCSISMIDFKTNRSIDGKTVYKCFWDKNSIPGNLQPIGCPIKYVPSRVTKSYHSEISKETYTISEPITEKRRKDIEKRKDKRLNTESKGYYETDGVFCSFNCCMAFIDAPENRTNPFYQHSESLLLKMYNDLNQDEGEIKEIMIAPHWRTLIDFGGHLTIEKFRESFNKILYQDHGVISCMSMGRLFEDKIKF
jgi:hypothetical protein